MDPSLRSRVFSQQSRDGVVDDLWSGLEILLPSSLWEGLPEPVQVGNQRLNLTPAFARRRIGNCSLEARFLARELTQSCYVRRDAGG